MSRGKYASASDARRIRETAISEVEAGRRHIVRLTEEQDRLKAKMAAERKKHADDVRHLRAMLSEGLSPELRALEARLKSITEERDTARAHAREDKEKLRRLSQSLGEIVHAHSGLSGGPLYEALARLLPGVLPLRPDGLVIENAVEQRLFDKHGADAVRSIRRARGRE